MQTWFDAVVETCESITGNKRDKMSVKDAIKIYGVNRLILNVLKCGTQDNYVHELKAATGLTLVTGREIWRTLRVALRCTGLWHARKTYYRSTWRARMATIATAYNSYMFNPELKKIIGDFAALTNLGNGKEYDYVVGSDAKQMPTVTADTSDHTIAQMPPGYNAHTTMVQTIAEATPVASLEATMAAIETGKIDPDTLSNGVVETSGHEIVPPIETMPVDAKLDALVDSAGSKLDQMCNDLTPSIPAGVPLENDTPVTTHIRDQLDDDLIVQHILAEVDACAKRPCECKTPTTKPAVVTYKDLSKAPLLEVFEAVNALALELGAKGPVTANMIAHTMVIRHKVDPARFRSYRAGLFMSDDWVKIGYINSDSPAAKCRNICIWALKSWLKANPLNGEDNLVSAFSLKAINDQATSELKADPKTTQSTWFIGDKNLSTSIMKNIIADDKTLYGNPVELVHGAVGALLLVTQSTGGTPNA